MCIRDRCTHNAYNDFLHAGGDLLEDLNGAFLCNLCSALDELLDVYKRQI